MSHHSESGYSSDESQVRSRSNINIERDERRFAKTYAVVNQLVDSTNGVIFNGVHIRSGREVIIKQIPKKVVSEYFNVNGRMCPSEIYFHFEAFKVTNLVVKPIGWFERRSSYVLVMEPFEDGIDLFQFSSDRGAVNEEAVKLIFHQIVECASKLHSAGIIHRDYKDENVLINPRTLEIKIIDFGCATSSKASFTSSAGTMEYFPPEWFSHSEYEAEPLTVWSLGSILYILLTGQWDFEDETIQRDLLAEQNLSQNAKSLIDSVLCPFPSKRANLESVLNSDWLASVN